MLDERACFRGLSLDEKALLPDIGVDIGVENRDYHHLSQDATISNGKQAPESLLVCSRGDEHAPRQPAVRCFKPRHHLCVRLTLASWPRSLDDDLKTSHTPLLCFEHRTGSGAALHGAKWELLRTRQAFAIGCF